jgi:Ni/Co efflux regulator RcnB
MKTLVATVVALSFVAGLAGQADAATYTKKKRLHSTHSGKQYSRAYGYRHPDDSIGGYYEHRLDAVRFGSQRWWKIYDEQSGGRHR